MLELLSPALSVERRPDAIVLTSTTPLPPAARCVGAWLSHWARARPDVCFLAERDTAGAWREVSYAAALRAVEGIGSALLARGAHPTRPVMLLSDNRIDGALLMLGAMHAGVPAAPVSPAYSLQSTRWERLRAVEAQLTPGFVYADDPARYAAALRAIARNGTILLNSTQNDPNSVAVLSQTPPSRALAEAFAALDPDTVAKVLFTSGSTGAPRGVVNTQRMLTSNQASLGACWPFLRARPPRFVDWLPWSHTFGGNHNFFLALSQGGSLYIDGGRPAPGLIETTLANLAEVSPSLWFNVPRGFDQAVAHLERDRALAERVFRRLDLIFYAAAALSPSTRARLEAVAVSVGRPEVFFTSAWGSTETSPLATSAHFPTATTGTLGVPIPGVSLKLARAHDGYELRVRGPNVTPGYWRPGGAVDPIALDDEGYLPTGDAGRLADDARPDAGVVFAGRLSENFKLSSGTWVHVAGVRLALLDACAPLLIDAVLAGHDRSGLGALLFPTPAALALDAEDLRARLRASIEAYNMAHPGNSTTITRATLADAPLSLEEGETTDKGYTNQRRVLERRASQIARMLDAPGDKEDEPHSRSLVVTGE